MLAHKFDMHSDDVETALLVSTVLLSTQPIYVEVIVKKMKRLQVVFNDTFRMKSSQNGQVQVTLLIHSFPTFPAVLRSSMYRFMDGSID